MLELRIINGAQAMPVFDLPALLGRRGAVKELGDQIDALMAFYDDLAGDPDLEDGGDTEPDGTDFGDQSWPEGIRQDRWPMSMLQGQYREDTEDDDHGEEDDHPGDGIAIEDSFETPWLINTPRMGAGCPLSDPGGCQHDGREQEEAY